MLAAAIRGHFRRTQMLQMAQNVRRKRCLATFFHLFLALSWLRTRFSRYANNQMIVPFSWRSSPFVISIRIDSSVSAGLVHRQSSSVRPDNNLMLSTADQKETIP